MTTTPASTGSRDDRLRGSTSSGDRNGANVLPEPVRESPWAMLLAQLPTCWPCCCGWRPGWRCSPGCRELAVAIVVIVLLNGLFAFLQEYRADRSTERCARCCPPTARASATGGHHRAASRSSSSTTWCC